jgi:hypothetical protein
MIPLSISGVTRDSDAGTDYRQSLRLDLYPQLIDQPDQTINDGILPGVSLGRELSATQYRSGFDINSSSTQVGASQVYSNVTSHR